MQHSAPESERLLVNANRLPQSKIDLIIQLAKDRWPTKQIAETVGCCTATVTRHRIEAGYRQNKAGRPVDAEELARAKALLEDGCSYKEVARTLGRSQSKQYRDLLPGMGWPISSGGQHWRDRKALEEL